MYKRFRQLIVSFLIMVLFLCGCRFSGIAASGEISKKDQVSQQFDDFTKQLFIDAVSTDALTLHYELMDPSAYDISLDTLNLGRIDRRTAAHAESELEDTFEELHSFAYDKLTDNQQLTFDILDEYLRTELSVDNRKLFYYPEYLSSTSGTHSILPILMSEFTFYDKEDIDIYLALLNDFPAYFDNILEFQRGKSEEGLFMPDEGVDEVVSACEEFIKNREDNMLIELFPEKLNSLSGLTDAEIADYTGRNRKAVLDSVIPAYESLIDGLNNLKGTGKNENGLYYFEHGQEYYKYLVKTQTGSSKSPDELIDWVEKTMTTDMMRLGFVLSADQSLYDRLNGTPEIELSDPDEILGTLQTSLKKNFPAAITDQYKLKYVPESLEDSMNPAFYMIPPVDNPNSNVIYLNNSQLSDNLSVFTTLAHEGYPGHLYQNNFFSAASPAPIRQQLNFLGYVEGWATYAENMSYGWTGLDNGMTRCMQLNQSLTLGLYARIDLGIHYEGWTEEDVAQFLTDYGIEDSETIHEVFRTIVSDPAAYLPYCIGFMEIQALRDETEEAMGSDFNLKDFHQFLLNLGPCQFDIADKYIDIQLLIN